MHALFARKQDLRADLEAILCLALVYFLCAHLGLSLAAPEHSKQITVVWPPTGLALAAVLLIGYRVWPGIALGAFVVNFIIGWKGGASAALLSATGIAVGNTLEALVGAYLLRRVARFENSLQRVRDVLSLVFFGALGAPLLSATIGVCSLAAVGSATWDKFFSLWWVWWLGDATGALIVAPFLLTCVPLVLQWYSQRGNVRRSDFDDLRPGVFSVWRAPPRKIEIVLFFATLTAVLCIIFLGPFGESMSLKYFAFPVFIWSALRLGQAVSAAGLVVCSAFAILLYIPSNEVTVAYSYLLMLIETYIGTLSISTLLLGAVMEERHLAELSKREAEQRLHIAMHAGSMGAWDWDLASGKVLWTTQLEHIHGIAPGSFRGRIEDFQRYVHPEDLQRVMGTIDAALKSGNEYQIEYRIIRPVGTVAWLEARGSVLRNIAGGKAQRMLGVCMDVTARKHTEQRLLIQYRVTRALAGAKDLPEAMRLVLESVGTILDFEFAAFWKVISATEPLTCIETWNTGEDAIREFEAITRNWRFPPGVGLPGRVWNSAAPAWISDVVRDDNFPRASHAAQANVHTAIAFPIMRDDRVLGVMEFFTREIRQPDEAVLGILAAVGGQLGQFIDRLSAVDSLRRSEAHKGSMLKAALDCIVGMDVAGNVIEFNPAAESIFGYRREEVIGREMCELIIPASFRESHRMGLDRYRMTGEDRILGKRIEMIAMRRGGEEFPVELTISRNPGEGPPTFTGFVRDISERRRAEEQRNALLESERIARGEAERANRIKDEFLSTLSHELRTPLNAILGWAQLLRRGKPDEETLSQGVESIERSARLQATLIEDLLDMSRIISGKLKIALDQVELANVITAAIETVQPAADAKNVTIGLDLTPGLVVRGDAIRLQQIVWNLLTNAVKFTPAGGRIQVRSGARQDAAEVAVCDTGMGIRPDFLPLVFERFSQADSSSTRKHGGLGLGLAIVKHLVELHGGSVWAESPGVNQGSTFGLRVPLTQPACIIPTRPRHGATPVVDDGKLLASVRVLVVDDDQSACEMVHRMLSDHGAEVETINSAQGALQHLAKSPIDILISDIGMPGMDGYELIGELRKRGATLKAVAVTAFARPEDRARSLEAGFDEHIAKPVDVQKLIVAIAALTKGQNREMLPA